MTITRSAAEAFADSFGIDLWHKPETGEVRGEKIKEFKVLGILLDFSWKICASFGDVDLRGADAGIALDGPGDLGSLLVRRDKSIGLIFLDKGKLLRDGRLVTLGEWLNAEVEAFRKTDPEEGFYLQVKYLYRALGEAALGVFEKGKDSWKRVEQNG